MGDGSGKAFGSFGAISRLARSENCISPPRCPSSRSVTGPEVAVFVNATHTTVGGGVLVPDRSADKFVFISKRLRDVGFPGQVLFRLLDPEYPAAHVVQGPVSDELFDGAARLERRVELEERFRPERPGIEGPVHRGPYERIADLDETAGVAGVVADQALSKIKDVHAGRRSG